MCFPRAKVEKRVSAVKLKRHLGVACDHPSLVNLFEGLAKDFRELFLDCHSFCIGRDFKSYFKAEVLSLKIWLVLWFV